MGIFRQFPYTNFHELNLDEILRKIKSLSDQWDKFSVDVIEKIKDEVDAWLDAHPEATTTVQDGSITEQKFYPPMVEAHRVWVNVASVVPDYDLNNDNIADAILAALELSNYIYIPAGDFTFNVEITTDCTMILDDDCIIRTAAPAPWFGNPIIYAHDCSFNMYGGTLCVGENDGSQIAITEGAGAIYIKNCHDSSIRNLNSPYSKTNSVIWVRNCINFTLENSTFKNLLRAAMFICDSCKNVAVRNCYFENSAPLAGETFCYFVYTGMFSFTSGAEPIDGLIYENNYGVTSMDCAFDTHGAKNVIIRNNTILDTVCAITAYNDNRRATRPVGWTMTNILIENNFCKSTRKNSAAAIAANLAHPFLFLGSANYYKPSEAGGAYDVCAWNTFENCIVRNNVFETNNDYDQGAIYLNAISRNVVFENNDFYFDEDAVAYIIFRRCMYFRFVNNRTRSFSDANTARCLLSYNHCYGYEKNNIGFRHSFEDNYLSYVNGLLPEYANRINTCLKLGDVVWLNNTAQICKSFGLSRRSGAASGVPAELTFTTHLGVATVTGDTTDLNGVLPNLRLSLTETGGTTVSAYVKDLIDVEHFTLVDGNGAPIGDGSWTATYVVATTVSL